MLVEAFLRPCVARFGEPRTLLDAEFSRAKNLELNIYDSTNSFDSKILISTIYES